MEVTPNNAEHLLNHHLLKLGLHEVSTAEKLSLTRPFSITPQLDPLGWDRACTQYYRDDKAPRVAVNVKLKQAISCSQAVDGEFEELWVDLCKMHRLRSLIYTESSFDKNFIKFIYVDLNGRCTPVTVHASSGLGTKPDEVLSTLPERIKRPGKPISLTRPDGPVLELPHEKVDKL